MLPEVLIPLLEKYFREYKTKTFVLSGQFSEQYRTHMFTIHQLYMNDLREKKLFVTNTVVQKYVNEMHPSLLMYSLNYQMRKRNVDTIVADN